MSTFITKRAKELDLKKTDARKPLTIILTKPDISNAKQKNSKCCAFARAAKRQFQVKNAYFFRSTAWLEYEDRLVRYALPQSVQKEIVSFDRTKVMAPGTYQLSKPSPHKQFGSTTARGKDNRRRHDKGQKGRGAKVRHMTQLVRNTQEPA